MNANDLEALPSFDIMTRPLIYSIVILKHMCTFNWTRACQTKSCFLSASGLRRQTSRLSPTAIRSMTNRWTTIQVNACAHQTIKLSMTSAKSYASPVDYESTYTASVLYMQVPSLKARNAALCLVSFWSSCSRTYRTWDGYSPRPEECYARHFNEPSGDSHWSHLK